MLRIGLTMTLFFYWGMLSLMNDLLIPFYKADFSLSYFQATLIQFSFFLSYLVFAFPAVFVLNRLSYQRSIILALGILVLGAMFSVMAIKQHVYLFILIGLFILGSGIVLLQVTANPLLAQLGPKKTSSARMTLGHAITSLGYTLGPILLASLITLPNMPWIYSVIAIILILTAIAFYFSHLHVAHEEAPLVAFPWKTPLFILSLFGIFFAVGAEISVGSFFVNYLELPEVGALTPVLAMEYLSLYWGAAMIGRFLGAPLLLWIRPEKLLAIYGAINILLLMGVSLVCGKWGFYAILAIGFFNSIMFPVIFSLGLLSFDDPHHKNMASASLVFATCGGAVFPVIQGSLADHAGLPLSFLVQILPYSYLIFFGFIKKRVK